MHRSLDQTHPITYIMVDGMSHIEPITWLRHLRLYFSPVAVKHDLLGKGTETIF
jgi:hypothetical protein